MEKENEITRERQPCNAKNENVVKRNVKRMASNYKC